VKPLSALAGATTSFGTDEKGSLDRVAGLLVDALASYRFVKLVRDDRITEPAREAVQERTGPPDQSQISYLMTCPWCLSIYSGAALTLGRMRWPRTTNAVARIFALSALTGIASQHLDSAGGDR
jgi:hypothetical protein